VTGPVVAARFFSIGEAEMAVSTLQAAGIESWLVDEEIVRVDWTVALAVGGIKLVVGRADLEAAQAVLRAAPAEADPAAEVIAAAEEPPPAVEIRCPDCGSADYAPIPRVRMFLLFAAAFIGFGVAVGEPAMGLIAFIAVAVAIVTLPTTRCRACGHRWNPPEPEQKVFAPGPDAHDLVEQRCPRCGSAELGMIDYRRLKAWPLLFNPLIFIAAPIWLMSPRRVCESCGLKF
jgi:hypothetical protein